MLINRFCWRGGGGGSTSSLENYCWAVTWLLPHTTTIVPTPCVAASQLVLLIPALLSSGGSRECSVWGKAYGHESNRYDTQGCADWTMNWAPEHGEGEALKILEHVGQGRSAGRASQKPEKCRDRSPQPKHHKQQAQQQQHIFRYRKTHSRLMCTKHARHAPATVQLRHQQYLYCSFLLLQVTIDNRVA